MKKKYNKVTNEYMKYLEELMAPIPDLGIPVELPTIRESIALKSQVKKYRKRNRNG
jgi:hypothetical protein